MFEVTQVVKALQEHNIILYARVSEALSFKHKKKTNIKEKKKKKKKRRKPHIPLQK